MKYFLLKTDPQFDTSPVIAGWFQKIDRRNIQLGKSHDIENRQLFFIESNPITVFPDVLSFPAFMVTEKLRDVIRLYEPKMLFKEIVLLDQKYAKACTYHLPVLEYVDCLTGGSILTKDRSTIISAEIDPSKINEHSIAYIASVSNLYIIARLDIVESFLRRGAQGISLTDIKQI
ncbi:MAG: hypothetical protein NC489_37670 [Ruminococcus flavefaciens]|nr:hypothetical protein [Ruminococcus flavefaciens]